MAYDPTRPNTWKTLGKLVASLVAVGVLCAGVLLPYIGGLGVFAGKAAGKFLNTTCNLQESTPPLKTTLYANDGKTVLATLFTQDRQPVPLSQIPTYLQDALIATEDRRFYQHHGVDLRGLIRSAVSTSGGDTQGGSTLTMQYVKQVRYFQAVEANNVAAENAAVDQNLNRKMEDAQCALAIEKRESKATILDNYLNIAFFGENAYGIQTAAQTYFHVNSAQLTLAQSALLVGLLRAPSDYDPYQHLAAAKARRDQVLQNLVSVGKLSQAAADKVEAEPVSLYTQNPPAVHQGCANSQSTVKNAGFFCEYAVDWLENVQGMQPADLNTGGYKIVTTLSPQIQNTAQAQMNSYVAPTSPMTAVLPVVDPQTGDVLAMASSKTYGIGTGQTEQPVFTKDVATGGSTYKLFALLQALSIGVSKNWALTTVGNSGTYTPSNCSTSKPVHNGDDNVDYNNTETLASASAKSSNTFFVGMVSDVLDCNMQPIIDLMAKLGMTSMQNHDPIDNPKLTYAQNVVDNERAQELVLGSIPTSPLEITGAYAAVANGGVFNAPAPILKITNAQGQQIAPHRAQPVVAVDPQAAASAAQILTGDTLKSDNGTSASKFTSWYDGSNGSKIAGKTGTNPANDTQNSSILFAGMTPDLAATAAVINFDNPSSPSTGLKGQGAGTAYGDFAAQIWLKALQPVISKQTWSWQDPTAVDGSSVPPISGESLSDATYDLQQAGYKIAVLGGAGFQCGGPQNPPTAGDVGYYGPNIAPAGSTITVCLSNGIPQNIVQNTPPAHHNTPPGHGNGNTTPGRGTGSSNPGHGTGSGNPGRGHSSPPPHH